MLKIGDHEVTYKDLILAAIFVVVAIMAIWAMIGSKSKPSGPIPGQLTYPRGIAVDSHGDIYVADSKNHRIQKFDGKDLKFIKAFGGYAKVEGDTKKLLSGSLGKVNEPNGIAIGPEDQVYVADTWNGRIQVFGSDGSFKRAMTADDGFWGPREVVVDPSGYVYVADTGKHRIVKFNPKGEKIQVWGGKGSKTGQFNEPIGLAMDRENHLYVADRLNFRIQVFNPNGQFVREWKANGWSSEQIDMEPHLAVDQAHSILYATDGRGKKVLCFRLDGKKLPAIEKGASGNLLQAPIGVAVSKEGVVYITDALANKIYQLNRPEK